jgi:hypothetical protein
MSERCRSESRVCVCRLELLEPGCRYVCLLQMLPSCALVVAHGAAPALFCPARKDCDGLKSCFYFAGMCSHSVWCWQSCNALVPVATRKCAPVAEVSKCVLYCLFAVDLSIGLERLLPHASIAEAWRQAAPPRILPLPPYCATKQRGDSLASAYTIQEKLCSTSLKTLLLKPQALHPTTYYLPNKRHHSSQSSWASLLTSRNN